MHNHAKTRREDLKTVATVLAIVLAMGAISGAVYRVFTWSAGIQMIEEAKTEHDTLRIDLHQKLVDHDVECDDTHNSIVDEMKRQHGETKEDLKILRARTWELLGND